MGKHGGQSIVEVLKKEGVTKVFGVPGESYLNVLDAIYEEPSIEFISGRQEGGVSFIAEGYAKATGEVAVCMATRGPGATNLSAGLHTAQQDSTPMVAMLGQVERHFIGREAFQEVDFASYFKDLCKWSVEIDDANRIPEILHRAFHVARSGRPGPVVVSLPEDMQDDIVDGRQHELFGPIQAGRPRPEKALVKEAAEKLSQAKKPIIIAGGGVNLSKGATENLVKVSEALNIPVATAFRRFHAFPNTHPNYAGTLGLGAMEGLTEYIQESDLVLALGTKFSQMTTSDYTLLNEKSELIHVDISSDMLGRAYKPTLPIVADANAFLVELLKIIEPVQSEEREKNLQDINDKYVDFSTPHLTNQEQFADLKTVIHTLREQLPENAIVTSDAGNFFSWISRYYRFGPKNLYLGPTSGAMGYGMPAAIGAKVAFPEKVVVSISGDGGFMMTMQEFETAVRYNVPIIQIIANNNIYGTIRAHQEAKFPERVIATKLSNPNYADLATNFGGYGERVSHNDQFADALQRAIESKKPAIIEIVTNPTILSAKQEEAMRQNNEL